MVKYNDALGTAMMKNSNIKIKISTPKSYFKWIDPIRTTNLIKEDQYTCLQSLARFRTRRLQREGGSRLMASEVLGGRTILSTSPETVPSSPPLLPSLLFLSPLMFATPFAVLYTMHTHHNTPQVLHTAFLTTR